jgi:uncharacterized glyoxalase superfamily protein PhnB
MAYRDAAAAIEWICETFGFEKHAVYSGEGGTIAHAELRFGNGMIMCGSKNDGPFGRFVKQPDEGTHQDSVIRRFPITILVNSFESLSIKTCHNFVSACHNK